MYISWLCRILHAQHIIIFIDLKFCIKHSEMSYHIVMSIKSSLKIELFLKSFVFLQLNLKFLNWTLKLQPYYIFMNLRFSCEFLAISESHVLPLSLSWSDELLSWLSQSKPVSRPVALWDRGISAWRPYDVPLATLPLLWGIGYK